MEGLSAAAAQAAAIAAADRELLKESAAVPAPFAASSPPAGFSISDRMATSSASDADDDIVLLNVGDSSFRVRRGVFASHPETMLGALFSGRHDPSRRVFRFDGQNALAFATILKYYQGSEISWDEPPAGVSERVWLNALDFWGIFPQLPPSIATEVLDGFHEHVALLLDAMHTARPLLLDRLKAGYLPCVRFVSPYYASQPIEETLALRDFLASWVGEHPQATVADAIAVAVDRPGAWSISDGYARTVVRGLERFLAVGYAELHGGGCSSCSAGSRPAAISGGDRPPPPAPVSAALHAGLGRSAGPMVGLLPRPADAAAGGAGRSAAGSGSSSGMSTGAGAVQAATTSAPAAAAPAPGSNRFGPQLPSTPISQDRLMSCNAAAAVIAATTAANIYAASTLITYSKAAQHLLRREFAREGLRLGPIGTTTWPEDASGADLESSGILNPYDEVPSMPGSAVVKLWSSRLRGSANLEPSVWKQTLSDVDRRRLAEAKVIARRGVTYVLLDVTPM